MKNYEEMTKNVFHRRDAYLAKKNQQRIVVGSTLAAAACLTGVITLRQGHPTTENSTLFEATLPSQTLVQTQPPTSPIPSLPAVTEANLTVLAYTVNGSQTQLEKNIALPLAYYMGVTDIRSLSTEEEIKTLMDRQSAATEEYLQKLCGSDDLRGICHARVLRRENFIISSLRCGSLQLCLDQMNNIQSINVKTSSGYGEVTVHQDVFDDSHSYERGFDVTVDTEALTDNALLIDWMYSAKLLAELETDPTAALTDFSDTITVTVIYQNGTEQSCCIDIIINEDSSIWALLHSQQNQI